MRGVLFSGGRYLHTRWCGDLIPDAVQAALGIATPARWDQTDYVRGLIAFELDRWLGPGVARSQAHDRITANDEYPVLELDHAALVVHLCAVAGRRHGGRIVAGVPFDQWMRADVCQLERWWRRGQSISWVVGAVE